MIYENNELKYILTDEGRILVDEGTYKYQYHLTDHLGNTRVTFDTEGNILQEDSYYPFGMTMNGLSYTDNELLDLEDKNKFLYNGKELDEEFGLNLYHYGFRLYDPVLGRFPSIDPISDKFPNLSSYNYASNNPIVNIDLHGLQGVRYDCYEKGKIIKTVYELDVYVVSGTKGAHYKQYNGANAVEVSTYLTSAFKGDHSDPTSGAKIEFKFNVRDLDLSQTETKTNASGKVKTRKVKTEMKYTNKLTSKYGKFVFGETGKKWTFPAFVFDMPVQRTDGGKANIVLLLDLVNGKEGPNNILGHEVLHFLLGYYSIPGRDKGALHHRLNGLLGRPITTPHINKAILEMLYKYVPHDSSKDQKDEKEEKDETKKE